LTEHDFTSPPPQYRLYVGLPLTSSLLLESTRPSTLTSTRVLVTTGSTLIQAANDE